MTSESATSTLQTSPALMQASLVRNSLAHLSLQFSPALRKTDNALSPLDLGPDSPDTCANILASPQTGHGPPTSSGAALPATLTHTPQALVVPPGSKLPTTKHSTLDIAPSRSTVSPTDQRRHKSNRLAETPDFGPPFSSQTRLFTRYVRLFDSHPPW